MKGDYMMEEQCMLSTADNPFDPFKNFDEWYAWDHLHGYDSPSLLARMCPNTNALTPNETREIINETIKRIVSNESFPNFICVKKES